MGYKTRPALPAESATAPETDHPVDRGKAAAGATEIHMKTDQMNIIMTVIVIRTDTASRGTNLSVKHSSLPVPNQQSRLDTFYSTGPF